MCKITIIVPIYNVEKYLRECLDSLLNQTFKDSKEIGSLLKVEQNDYSCLVEDINNNNNIFKEDLKIKVLPLIKEAEILSNKYDCVVTNPPYMKLNTGAKHEEIKKLISRHEVECNLEDIIKISYKLLKSKGEFYMVHRAERIVDILYNLRKYKLEPKEIRFIHSKVGKEPNLVLIKAVKDAGEHLIIDSPLVVYNNDGTYTDEILKIYNKK